DAAARHGPPRVARRDDELGEPLDGRERQDDVEDDDHGNPWRSRTASTDTPGPNARTTAVQPAGRARAVGRASTWSTDADDRLPASASDARLTSSASPGSPRALVTASRILGPPACTTHASTPSTPRPCGARSAARS